MERDFRLRKVPHQAQFPASIPKPRRIDAPRWIFESDHRRRPLAVRADRLCENCRNCRHSTCRVCHLLIHSALPRSTVAPRAGHSPPTRRKSIRRKRQCHSSQARFHPSDSFDSWFPFIARGFEEGPRNTRISRMICAGRQRRPSRKYP